MNTHTIKTITYQGISTYHWKCHVSGCRAVARGRYPFSERESEKDYARHYYAQHRTEKGFGRDNGKSR